MQKLYLRIPHGSYSLGEAAVRLKLLRLKRGRAVSTRSNRLLERYGLGRGPSLIFATSSPSASRGTA